MEIAEGMEAEWGCWARAAEMTFSNPCRCENGQIHKGTVQKTVTNTQSQMTIITVNSNLLVRADGASEIHYRPTVPRRISLKL
jgi:hypothetical protein